jgi:hypothetical protein
MAAYVVNAVVNAARVAAAQSANQAVQSGLRRARAAGTLTGHAVEMPE